MPTYEYRCADCGHTFDIVQKFTDDSLTSCPECGGRLKKVFGNVGIMFKGSGFYVNDSGSNKHSSASPASSDTSAETPSSSSSSSDSSADSSSAGSDTPSSSDAGTKSSSDSKASASVD